MEEKAKMKRTTIGVLLIAAIAFIGLSSCDLASLFGTNQDTRLSDFFSQARAGQQDQLYLNFSSTQTAEYSQIKPASFWANTEFATGTDANLSSYSPSPITGSSASGSFTAGGGTFDFTATFVESGFVWYFQSFSWWPSGSAQSSGITIKVIN